MKQEFSLLRLAITVAAILLAAALGVYMIIKMPGHSHIGPLPQLTDMQKELASRLHAHVRVLATEIGTRSLASYDSLERSAQYIENELSSVGYESKKQEFQVNKKTVRNISVEIRGKDKPDEVIVIGAHYDSVPGTPGADDNASGTAALLELARLLKNMDSSRSIRLIFFVNEEPPFFQTKNMGSYHAAMESKRKGENIKAMLCLESIGIYSDEPGSQEFPPPLGLFYPDTGNFIGFVSNWASRDLLYTTIDSFRLNAQIPSEGLVAPLPITGTDWSDHWSYWKAGYKAIMITDTAPFRSRYYHTANDTEDKLDYERMARVTAGLIAPIIELNR